MSIVEAAQKDAFFRDVRSAASNAIWCALATVAGNETRARMVHFTWEGDVLWIATDPGSAKVREIRDNPSVDIQFQVAPDDFVHILAHGSAAVCTDQATRERIWDAMDYDLAQFWPDGPSSPAYRVLRVDPERVELSELCGTANKRVWKA